MSAINLIPTAMIMKKIGKFKIKSTLLLNPYKQPVVTLKQWIVEKKAANKERYFWKPLRKATDKINIAHLKLENALSQPRSYTTAPTYLSVEKLLQKYSDVLSESQISELKNYAIGIAEIEIDKISIAMEQVMKKEERAFKDLATFGVTMVDESDTIIELHRPEIFGEHSEMNPNNQ